MKSSQDITVKDLVLIGGGHSHVTVLKMFGMKPIPGVRLTVIARDVHTPYSGMLPGYVAGHYEYDDVHIDLRPLCQFAGARLYHDQATSINFTDKTVICKGRPAVPYDTLSINIGSTPSFKGVVGAESFTTPVKPINTFIERWHALVERISSQPGLHKIGVVGAGAGGIELLMAMQFRLNTLLAKQGQTNHQLEFHLITRTPTILPSFGSAVSRRVSDRLAALGIHVHTHAEAQSVQDGVLKISGGKTIELDEVLWVTAAAAPSWLGDCGLDVDQDGFVCVQDTLQSTSHPDVFAAGDIACVVNHPRPKAGVFAVRQGPPLTDNLRRTLVGEAAKPFVPQRNFLVLISAGDKYCIASKWGVAVGGKWVWRWKDWIDTTFMRKFSDLPEMKTDQAVALHPGLSDPTTLSDISAIAMRCGGCGAKVGSNVLTQALSGLEPVENDDVLVGLHAPDDAAVVDVPAGKVMVHTVDYFRSFIDDPYIFGKVAANHALSDIFAMGAQAQTALAIATVPFGVEAKVEATLREMMSGAIEVLNDAGASLVGGHTSEGPELALGFSVNGLADRDTILHKGGMVEGDVLILTKALGTGTLFAADMQNKAKGRWIEGAIKSMVQSNRLAAECVYEFGASACTDVTGFGFLGHLVEMTKASSVDVEIDLDALPILDGAQDTVHLGILSSLQPANVRLRRGIRNLEEMKNHDRYPLIFDPQTSGGLLASVSKDRAEACLAELHKRGYTESVQVGRVRTQSDALEPVTLISQRCE